MFRCLLFITVFSFIAISPVLADQQGEKDDNAVYKKKYYRYEIFLNPDLNISEGARVEFEGAGVEFKSKVWVLFDHDTGSTWVTPIDKESGQPGRSWRPLDFERNPQNIPGESSEGTNVE